MRRFAAAGTGVGLLGAAAAYAVSQDKGVQRSLQFWKEIAPVYLDYRMVQFRNETLGTFDDAAAMREVYAPLDVTYHFTEPYSFW